MSAPIIKQLEARVAELDKEFGRKRRAFVPPVPAKRDHNLRRVVHEKLGIPTEIRARIASRDAFKAGEGSLASLLVCRTSAVVEQCLFGGVPGIRAALIDLAAFSIIWADCVDVLVRPNTSRGEHGSK